MKGVFVNWTKPYVERNRLRGHAFKVYKNRESDEYWTADHEILYTILSVGYWKKFNGPTKLYTDVKGYEYYKSLNMLSLWDEIDISTLENYNDVDAAQFWTSGKSYCIGKEKAPFCFIDLDFIIKQKLPEWVFESEVTVAHWEIPRGYYYPTEDQYNQIKHWTPPSDFAFKMLIPNTSFLYINSKELQSEYLKTHLEAVNTKDEVPEWFWLLTDQGLFGQALRRLNIKTNSLTDRVYLADSEGYRGIVGEASGYYYPPSHNLSKDNINWWHVWIRKVHYNENEEFRIKDCKDFYNEIYIYLPEFRDILNNERLLKYST